MLIDKMSYYDQIGRILTYPYPEASMRDITIQVTEDCNLCCTYCYQHNKTHKAMNFETAKAFIDLIFDNREDPNAYYNIYNTSGFVMNFIGGEPFLEIELIDKIIEYTESKLLENENEPWLLSHCYNFSTNGTLYFTPKVEAFRNKWRELLAIGVTVDGNKELHDSCRLFPDGSGSYDLAALASWNEFIKGYDTSKITISPDNVKWVCDGIKSFIKKGHHFVSANCVFEEGWTKQSALKLYNELIKLSDWLTENNLYDKVHITILEPSRFRQVTGKGLDSNWCGVGKGRMSALDYTGKIYPCIRFMPSSLNKETEPMYLGDIEKGYLNDEQTKENYELLLKQTRGKLEPEECLKCPIEKGCSWCVGYIYDYYGEFKQKTLFCCEVHKLSALASKYLTKINNDKESFNLIQLNYKMYKDLIRKEDFDKINTWEGGK